MKILEIVEMGGKTGFAGGPQPCPRRFSNDTPCDFNLRTQDLRMVDCRAVIVGCS